MLRVCTINAGNYLGRGKEYTNNLYDMVRRNLPDGFEGTFTAFTDDPDGYDAGIEVRPLPHAGLSGWWNKLALFKPGVFDDGDRIVYIDLSTLITGRMDKIVAYDGPFAILRDFYRGGDALQSAFMMWEAGFCQSIWLQYERSGYPQIDGGDQAWIEDFFAARGKFSAKNGGFTVGKAALPPILQDIYPDLFVSYKISNGAIPVKAAVVKFHGEPRPHEVLTGWVPRVWKVGGMTRAELDTVCNTEKQIVLNNIKYAMALDYPWFHYDYSKRDDQACIVGGGPSLKDQLPALRWRKEQGQKIFSTNGAHDYLIANGIMPDYHVMLDARPENAAFVQHPKRETKYLIASQCAGSVFDALHGSELTRYNVVIFHNSTEGAAELLNGAMKPTHLLAGGTTVGMKAMLLAELMGFKAIHLYGMDSCYLDGAHHSYSQSLNDGERIVDVLYGDKVFKCSGWMASQAQDFLEFCMRSLVTITVAGNGLLAHIARCGIPENPVDMRAREILSRLPGGGIGAEIGVFAGDLSARLLMRDDITLFMVDSWRQCGEGQYAESGDWHATLTQSDQDYYMQMAINTTEFAKGRRIVLRNESVTASADVVMLDFVFIDADHSYDGCKADIAAWYPKVKQGGWICGHDYGNAGFPGFGVNQAVDEFIAANNLTLDLGDDFTWFARKA